MSISSSTLFILPLLVYTNFNYKTLNTSQYHKRSPVILGLEKALLRINMSVVLYTSPLSTHPHHGTQSSLYSVIFVDLRRLGKDARALHTYETEKVRQPVCTFTEADIFVLFQYGIGHSTRHRNFPATCFVMIGNNILCTKHIGEISHLVTKIDIALAVLCFQVKTLRFNLYSVQWCILYLNYRHYVISSK
jgi:hypothetical protein